MPPVVVRPDLVEPPVRRAARPRSRRRSRGRPSSPSRSRAPRRGRSGPGTGTVWSSPPVVAFDAGEAARAAAGAACRPCRPGRSSRSRAAPARSSRGRGRSLFSSLLVRRRPVLQEPLAVGREDEDAVAPVRLPVERPVAGRDEQVAGRGIDDRRRAAPDRRVARGAGRRLDDLVAVGAERVPDADDPAARRVERHDVPLVGRRVADVAVGRGEDEAVREVERRGELLVRRVARDRRRPEHLPGRRPRACGSRRRARRRRSRCGPGRRPASSS